MTWFHKQWRNVYLILVREILVELQDALSVYQLGLPVIESFQKYTLDVVRSRIALFFEVL